MAKKYDWAEIQAAYDSGNTYAELCSMFGTYPNTLTKAAKRGDLVVRPLAQRQSLGHKNRAPHSEATREKLSAVATERGFGGRNYRKTFAYNGVVLESSYELTLAQELDANGIKWERPKRFYWTDAEGKKRHYTPDFYLPDHGLYLDPKNDYLIKIDSDKIARVQEQNEIKVLILTKDQLTWSYIAGIA